MNSGTRNAQTKATLQCDECERMGYYARERPTRQEGRQNPSTRRERGT